jgi:hypothetical protein
MAEKIHVLTWGCVLSLVLTAAPAAAAPVQFGEMELEIQSAPQSGAEHGYTEYRIRAHNRSKERAHRVTLTLPGVTHQTHFRARLQSVSRTVEVGPGLTAPISLLAPSFPDIAGQDIEVKIDGRREDRLLPVGIAFGHRRGIFGRTRGVFGASSREPLVLVSQRIPENFFRMDVLGMPPEGMPGGAAGPGPGGPGGPGGPAVPPGPAPGGGPVRPAPPMFGRGGGMGSSVTFMINAHFDRAAAPISWWSSRWLGYSRYDGIVVDREDLAELQRGSNETRAVLQALWQFTETGGVLVVLGPGRVEVPASWARNPTKRAGISIYQVGFGQCLVVPDRNKEKWNSTWYEVNDKSVAALADRLPQGAGEKLKGINREFDNDTTLQLALATRLPVETVVEHWGVLEPGFRRESRWIVLNSALSQTLSPYSSSRTLSDLNQAFPVVDNLGVPVKSLFVVMILFALALGPINLVVLTKKRKRIWMLWTVPVLAFFASLAVFGSMIVSEGWQGHARVGGVTFLDESEHRATSLGRTAFYTPLTPGGLYFSEETEVLANTGEYGSCSVDWTQGQRLAHGWVTARIPAHFNLRKSETRRERLAVRRESDGSLTVVNALGADVEVVYVADEKGVVRRAGPLAAGEKATLELTSKRATTWPGENWRRLYSSSSDWMDNARRAAKRPEEFLGPGTYLAVVNGSPFLEQALPGAAVRDNQSIVLGLMADGGK